MSVLARILAFSALAALLAECSSSSSSAGSAGGSTIKIGIDLPVSGADASTGIPTRNGAVLAIEQANAKKLSGGFTFAADDLDDAVQGAHDPAQGAQNVRSFVADPSVLGMIGPFNSSVGAAEIPITNDAGLVQISPATTNPGLTKGDAAKRLRPSHPDRNAFFRVSATDDRQGAAAATFARKRGLAKAFVIDDDETYGKGLADVFEADFKADGGTVLGHEHLSKGQNDYKALLTKAHESLPDVIFFGGTTSTGGGLLRKQMGDAGMASVAYIGGDGIADAEFLKSAGTMANGTFMTVAAPDASHLPSAKTFVAEYEKRWSVPVGPYSASAFAATNVLIAAIEKAIAANGGKLPSRDAVLSNVAATQATSPIGPVSFDRNGDTTNGVLSVYEVAGGKMNFVSQSAAK